MILAEQTVGNIKYQIIDDIYPQHSETGGTIAIASDSTIYQCNGSFDWIKFSSPCNGTLYFTGGTTTPTYSPAINTWVYMSDRSWYSDNLKGFTVSANTLVLDKDIIGKFLLSNSTSFGGTINSTRYCSVDLGNIISGDTRPKNFNTEANDPIAVTNTGTYSNIASNSINMLKKGDKIIPAFAFNYKSNAASLIHFLQGYTTAYLLDKGIYLFNETFETTGSTSGFTSDWSLVQTTVNRWYVSTATSYKGTYSAYISSDGGATAGYNSNVSCTSHAYRDFYVPNNLTNVYIDFYWKCAGEAIADYGTVCIMPSGTTPVSGTEISASYRIGGTYLNNSAWRSSIIDITNNVTGGTYNRLALSFHCDGATGTSPGFCVDDIKIYFF